MVQELDMPVTRLKFLCVPTPSWCVSLKSEWNDCPAKPVTVLTSLFAMAAAMSPEEKEGLVKYVTYEALSDARDEQIHLCSSLYKTFETGMALTVLVSHIVALTCT